MADDRLPWHLELTPLDGEDWQDIPVGRRVARLLRYALRTCGLRCTSYGETAGKPQSRAGRRHNRTTTEAMEGQDEGGKGSGID